MLSQENFPRRRRVDDTTYITRWKCCCCNVETASFLLAILIGSWDILTFGMKNTWLLRFLVLLDIIGWAGIVVAHSLEKPVFYVPSLVINAFFIVIYCFFSCSLFVTLFMDEGIQSQICNLLAYIKYDYYHFPGSQFTSSVFWLMATFNSLVLLCYVERLVYHSYEHMKSELDRRYRIPLALAELYASNATAGRKDQVSLFSNA